MADRLSYRFPILTSTSRTAHGRQLGHLLPSEELNSPPLVELPRLCFLGVDHVDHRVGPEYATRFDKSATDERRASTETRG